MTSHGKPNMTKQEYKSFKNQRRLNNNLQLAIAGMIELSLVENKSIRG